MKIYQENQKNKMNLKANGNLGVEDITFIDMGNHIFDYQFMK